MDKCSECGRIVNDNAPECPKCGGFILTKKHGGSGIKKRFNKAIWKLYFKGYNQTEIAFELGISRWTVWMHLYRYGGVRI